MKADTAWIVKKSGGVIKATYASGTPSVQDKGGGRILTNGSSDLMRSGWIELEPTDQVILAFKGVDFIPTGVLLGEVKFS